MKDAIREIYSAITAPRTVSDIYTQVVRAQPCANHVQHIGNLSPAACRVPRGTKGQLAKLLDRAEIAFISASFHWLKPLTDEAGEETRAPGERRAYNNNERISRAPFLVKHAQLC